MTDDQSRRAFLTRAWRDALRAAPSVTSAMLPGISVPPFPPGTDDSPPALGPARSVTQASPVQDVVTVDDLLWMASEFGLADRRESLQALARPSVRLVPGVGGTGQSRLGKPLMQIDLAELAAIGLGSQLPATGLLQFHCDISDQGSRWRSARDLGAGVVHISAVPDQVPSLADSLATGPSNHLQLSLELSLPRVWSAPVQALDLDESEQESWQGLRRWLAGRQGVELFDDVDGTLVAHRLFGYPDETTGEMPMLCELLATGAELDDQPLVHPQAAQLESASRRWRLLLQVTAAPGFSWPWSRRYTRLYFWVDEQHLEAGDLSRVFAVAQ